MAAVLATLALLAGSPAVCAGWLPTPEARMACCTDDEHCPMQAAAAGEHGAAHAVSQADADRCCAAAEREDAAPSSTPSLPSAALAPVAAPLAFSAIDLETAHDAWRPAARLPAAHVPRHLLLSVLIV